MGLISAAQLNSAKVVFRVVHFVREPYDMVLSGYFYHSQLPPPPTGSCSPGLVLSCPVLSAAISSGQLCFVLLRSWRLHVNELAAAAVAALLSPHLITLHPFPSLYG